MSVRSAENSIFLPTPVGGGNLFSTLTNGNDAQGLSIIALGDLDANGDVNSLNVNATADIGCLNVNASADVNCVNLITSDVHSTTITATDLTITNINGSAYVAPSVYVPVSIPDTPVPAVGKTRDVPHTIYQSGVFPAGNYLVNITSEVFCTDHGTGITFTGGYFELRDNLNTAISVFSNFNDNVPYSTWAYGASLSLLWISSGANAFQVITEFGMDDGTNLSTYQVAGGGLVQVVRLS